MKENKVQKCTKNRNYNNISIHDNREEKENNV